MIDYKIILIISLVLAAWLSMAYLDSKYNLRLLAWLNGEQENPFKASKQNQAHKVASLQKEKADLKTEVESLRERVQVLEKIVTEPAYELNNKLSRL